MYGGKWYLEKVKEWGEPPREILALAIQYQENARQGLEIKESEPSISTEMSAAEPKKKGRAKAAPPVAQPEDLKTAAPAEDLKTAAPAEDLKPPPKRKTKKEEPKPKMAKPKVAKPKVSPKQTSDAFNHKEVAIPTHMEKTMEEFDTEGFEFEYISLVPFEVNETNYFRDRKKDKLYKNTKGSIGHYVGRWDPDMESIHTEVPDSDEEEE